MSKYSRRDFLKVGSMLAAAAGLSTGVGKVLADGLQRLATGQTRVLWLQGQSCSGCSVSVLNTETPDPVELLTEVVSLVFHQTLGAAQGTQVEKLIKDIHDQGDYLLVIEGSLPLKMPKACLLFGRPLTDQLPALIRRARAVVAVGTCASYGGIPAAEGNPTGAGSVKQFMESRGLPVGGRLINLPSCPPHPESVAGTLAYVVGKGMPRLDGKELTPTMFYGHCLHDECPRFHYWEKHEFAEHFGDEGCLFKLGCLGPLAYTSCSRRQWNSGVNYCIRAGAPCIGCSSPHFAKQKTFPFYRKCEEVTEVSYTEVQRKERA